MTETRRQRKDRASKAYAEGRLNEAIEIYREIIADEPNEIGAQLKIGDIERRCGRRKEAVAAYRTVAVAYATDGFLLKAIAICKMILQIDDRHNDTQNMLAELYAARRTPTAALPGFDREALVPPSKTPSSPELERRSGPGSSASARTDDTALGVGAGVGVGRGDAGVKVGSGSRTVDGAGIGTRGAEAVASGSPGGVPPASSTDVRRFWPAARPGLGSAKLPPANADDRATARDATEVEDAPIELVVRSRSTRLDSGSLSSLGQAQIPLFSELPKEAFVELLVKMEMRELTPGTYVIREGEVGDSFFVLASGRVRVERRRSDSSQVVLARLTDGAFFGEMALLQHGARTASVIVEEESQILEISKGLLEDIIQRYPSVARIVRDFYKHRLLSTAMATHPVFRPLDPGERRRLIERFESRAFPEGSVLLEEGRPGSGLYLLLHGRLRVTKTQDGVSVAVGELGTGDMFGEMSLLTAAPVEATVVALSDCFVLRLGKDEFDRVVMNNAEFLALLSGLSAERRRTNDEILEQVEATNSVGFLV
ncbi:MAG: cyclic nucleotide-binding domain-containing protein [Deltaproteobacteria bacterium]|nr:cyclic nucleotide-binding domain-containing protein [Deltaproteobacteria bacterium]